MLLIDFRVLLRRMGIVATMTQNHFSFQSFDILCVRGRSLSAAHDLVFAIQRKYLFIKFSFCTGDENIPKREGIRVEFVWHFGNQHLYDKNVTLATYIVQIDSGTPQMIIYVNIFFSQTKITELGNTH